MSNVAFLPGWHYTPSDEDKKHFEFLQENLRYFNAEILHECRNMTLSDMIKYKNQKHLRIRQVIGLVKMKEPSENKN